MKIYWGVILIIGMISLASSQLEILGDDNRKIIELASISRVRVAPSKFR